MVGSKLERLFKHPLYDIHILPLAAEERLLEKEQLLDYYMKKVSRWERSGLYFKTCKMLQQLLPFPFKLLLCLFSRRDSSSYCKRRCFMSSCSTAVEGKRLAEGGAGSLTRRP